MKAVPVKERHSGPDKASSASGFTSESISSAVDGILEYKFGDLGRGTWAKLRDDAVREHNEAALADIAIVEEIVAQCMESNPSVRLDAPTPDPLPRGSVASEMASIDLEEHAFLGIFNVALSIYVSFSLAVLFCTPMGAWRNSLS